MTLRRSIARYANIMQHIRTQGLLAAPPDPTTTVHADVSTPSLRRPPPPPTRTRWTAGCARSRSLARHPDGLSVSELAAALDTHRAAVYRLLGPLGDHHLVRREPDGRFTLAPGLIELAAGVRPRLQEVAEPVLQRLADRSARPPR